MGVILPEQETGSAVENGFALDRDELPLEDLPQPVLELLNQLSALSQAVKEQRWQGEALNSNCCASTPTTTRVLGAIVTLHQCVN